MDGALTAKSKELMGMVASACLRCDDCISYHAIQCYRLGVTRAEQEEAINVAMVVGGTIVIRTCGGRMSCWGSCIQPDETMRAVTPARCL